MDKNKFDYRANLVEICSKLDLDELIPEIQYLTDEECKRKIQFISRKLDELGIPYKQCSSHPEVEY